MTIFAVLRLVQGIGGGGLIGMTVGRRVGRKGSEFGRQFVPRCIDWLGQRFALALPNIRLTERTPVEDGGFADGVDGVIITGKGPGKTGRHSDIRAAVN